MKKISLIVMLFLFSDFVLSMNDLFTRSTCGFEYDKSSNTAQRQQRFNNFILGEMSKISNIDSAFKKTFADIDNLLSNHQIALHFREQSSGNLACFTHNLDYETDFDDNGFLTDKAVQEVKTKGLAIDVNCKYSVDTRSFVIFKEGQQELWCETPYCGNVMKKGNFKLREIGVTLCPFYVILFHELLHLKHFLETVDFQLTNRQDKAFIPYGKALSIQNKDDYEKKLTNEQKDAFGNIVEFEDNFFVEQLSGELESIATNENPSKWKLKNIQNGKALELKKNGLKKNNETGKYTWNKQEFDLSIIKRLAANPDWENLE